jgi:hypothetical protein
VPLLITRKRLPPEFECDFQCLKVGTFQQLLDPVLMYSARALTYVVHQPACHPGSCGLVSRYRSVLHHNHLVTETDCYISATHLKKEFAKKDGWCSLTHTSVGVFPPTGDARREALEKILIFRHIVTGMEDHAALLRSAILRTTFASDAEQVIPLRSSLVTTLAAKAVMHSLLPSHPESRRMALEAVKSIISTTQVLDEPDLDFVDPVMGVSVNVRFLSLTSH